MNMEKDKEKKVFDSDDMNDKITELLIFIQSEKKKKNKEKSWC